MAIEIKQNGDSFVAGDGSKTVAVHFRFGEMSALVPAATKLKHDTEALTSSIVRLIARYSPEALRTEIGNALAPYGRSLKAFHSEVIARKRTLYDAKERVLKNSFDPERAKEIRATLKGTDPIKVFSTALKDPETLSAVMQFPNTFALSPDLVKQLEEKSLENAYYRVYANQNPAKPTLNNLFPDGENKVKAAAMAAEGVANMKKSCEEIETAGVLLERTIALYALLGFMTPQDALDRIDL